jgi:hypothetical protein
LERLTANAIVQTSIPVSSDTVESGEAVLNKVPKPYLLKENLILKYDMEKESKNNRYR